MRRPDTASSFATPGDSGLARPGCIFHRCSRKDFPAVIAGEMRRLSHVESTTVRSRRPADYSMEVVPQQRGIAEAAIRCDFLQ